MLEGMSDEPHNTDAELLKCKLELERYKEELERCRADLELYSARAEKSHDEKGRFSRFDAQTVPILSQTKGSSSVVVISDFVKVAVGAPLELSVEDLARISEEHDLWTGMWKFSLLQGNETLRDHVQRKVDAGDCHGPSVLGHMIYASPKGLKQFRMTSVQDADKLSSLMWSNVAHHKQEWRSQVKNIRSGNYNPLDIRGVQFAVPGTSTSSGFFKTITWPVVVLEPSGNRYWGMMQQVTPMSTDAERAWALRDLLTVKHTPACISVVSQETGRLLWQNAASMEMFGCHGIFNVEKCGPVESNGRPAPDESEGPSTSQHKIEGPTSLKNSREASSEHWSTAMDQQYAQYAHGGSGNFMNLLFGHEDSVLNKLLAVVRAGRTYRTQVEIVNPELRSLMGLVTGEEAHHDVQVLMSKDPVTLEAVYTISQIDVTSAVVAQRELQQAHFQLAEEKVRTEALLTRQRELIECIGWVSEVGRSAVGDTRAAELIEGVWRQMVISGGAGRVGGEMSSSQSLGRTSNGSSYAAGASESSSEDAAEVTMLELLGEGAYGKVYRGTWRNMVVAVKCMVLPIKMSGAEKRERMAIVEAAISSSLSHPNIVRTFTYSMKPVRDSAAAGIGGYYAPAAALSAAQSAQQAEPSGVLSGIIPPSKRSNLGAVSAFMVQIVQELCDFGSLREALDRKAFNLADGNVNYPAVLETALDIARGMKHLHGSNILHADLKAHNILLLSTAGGGRGVTAKISDFGLSLKLNQVETHVSNMFQGTMTHMAPETLLDGQQSNAADVYAFGITLWELYTGGHPFKGIPQAMLGHQVAHENVRPVFPPGTPNEYEVLTELCWQTAPAGRPAFDDLEGILSEMCEIVGPCNVQVQGRVPLREERVQALSSSWDILVETMSQSNSYHMPLTQQGLHAVGSYGLPSDFVSAGRSSRLKGNVLPTLPE